MTRGKKPKDRTSVRPHGQKLVLMGDVREAPFIIQEGGRSFHPVVALWVRADDGYVVGQLVDEPGHLARTLVQALLSPTPLPGQPHTSAIPSQIVLFSEELAKQIQPLLTPLRPDILISQPFEPFDELFATFFAQLEQVEKGWAGLDLPEENLRPLVAAAERLWRAKPWEYVGDYPPFSLVPGQDNGRPLFASILGSLEDILGVVLYTSLQDYENTRVLGGATVEMPPEGLSPAAAEAAAAEVLEALRQPIFLVSFEPKDGLDPVYREELAQHGWSRRLSKVPRFLTMGGTQGPAFLTDQDASDVALAIEALVTFCQRHRQQLANDEFPLRETVEVSLAGKTIRVDVAVPGEDPAAPSATVYRFKVALTYQKDVWRTIDVLSNQTLADLHYAIQDAFGWDDDHLYAFFLSGKAWDAATEYLRPEGQGPGERNSLVRLDRLALRPRKRFLYIFDFGDEWRHEIRVEKVGLPPDGGEYPRIVEKHGEAPPQYRYAEEYYEDEAYLNGE